MIDHYPDCQDYIDAVNEGRKAWARRWPNHCRECEGRGGHWSTYDPSPAGVGLGSGTMTDLEPCEECGRLSLCPRCGRVMDLECDDPCPHCGWDWTRKEGDCMLEEPECFCWHRGEPSVYEEYRDLYGDL